MSGRYHWGPWLWTCALSLLPLELWLLVRHVTDARIHVTSEATRELLFFALSLSSASLVELRNALYRVHRSTTFDSHFQACHIIAIITAVLYGVLLTGEFLRDATIVRHMYACSIAAAVFAAGFGADVQRIIHAEDHNAIL